MSDLLDSVAFIAPVIDTRAPQEDDKKLRPCTRSYARALKRLFIGGKGGVLPVILCLMFFDFTALNHY